MSKIFSLGDTVNSKKTRLFLGPNSDHRNIQTYHDPKYKWILDFAEELRAIGNWSKNEIDLSKEKTDYDGLDEAGRHIYEAGLKFAITLDSCAGRGMLQLFNNGGISNNPEWELYITNHQNNELLHSESYTEMVRAIYNDVDDFVDSITKDEHIQARASTILKNFDYSNDVFEKNEANNTAKAHGKNILFPEIDEKTLKTAIYRAALVVNMFEGIRFFATFVANWSFSEQPVKLMQGSSNIFKLIARDEMIHLDVFQQVINMLHNDKSEGFKELAKEMEPATYIMFQEAYEEEKVWIEYLFSKGSPLIGMNAQILQEYMDYIFAVRMRNIGLNPKKIGLSGDTYNPVPWVDNYLDSSNVKSAPQEIESVNYIAAIDNSKDTDFTMDEL